MQPSAEPHYISVADFGLFPAPRDPVRWHGRLMFYRDTRMGSVVAFAVADGVTPAPKPPHWEYIMQHRVDAVEGREGL